MSTHQTFKQNVDKNIRSWEKVNVTKKSVNVPKAKLKICEVLPVEVCHTHVTVASQGGLQALCVASTEHHGP
jgi:hypothetical protein